MWHNNLQDWGVLGACYEDYTKLLGEEVRVTCALFACLFRFFFCFFSFVWFFLGLCGGTGTWISLFCCCFISIHTTGTSNGKSRQIQALSSASVDLPVQTTIARRDCRGEHRSRFYHCQTTSSLVSYLVSFSFSFQIYIHVSHRITHH